MKTLFSLFLLSAIVIYAFEPDSQPVPPEGMVYVPAGNFIMGSHYGDPDERPVHIAYTKAFFIDKYEVSYGEYAKFDPDFVVPEVKENNALIVPW